jgi:hypothetical protein
MLDNGISRPELSVNHRAQSSEIKYDTGFALASTISIIAPNES